MADLFVFSRADPFLCLSFLKLFSQIGKTYAELFPKIEEERPEVMAKLIELRSMLDESLEEQRKLCFSNR